MMDNIEYDFHDEGFENQLKIQKAEIDGIMSTEANRRVVYRWLEDTGYFDDMFDVDSHIHAYKAGERSFGCHMVNQLQEACQDKYLLMLQENTNG